MKCYRVYLDVIFNGYQFSDHNFLYLSDEVPKDEIYEYNGLFIISKLNAKEFDELPFIQRHLCTYGRRTISKRYWLKGDPFDYKHNIHVNDTITYKVSFVETTASINDILEYCNGDKATKWLTERGFHTCPLKKKEEE